MALYFALFLFIFLSLSLAHTLHDHFMTVNCIAFLPMHNIIIFSIVCQRLASLGIQNANFFFFMQFRVRLQNYDKFKMQTTIVKWERFFFFPIRLLAICSWYSISIRGRLTDEFGYVCMQQFPYGKKYKCLNTFQKRLFTLLLFHSQQLCWV